MLIIDLLIINVLIINLPHTDCLDVVRHVPDRWMHAQRAPPYRCISNEHRAVITAGKRRTVVDNRMDVLLATSRLSARISTAFESCTGSSITRFTILYALSTSSPLPQTELRSLLGINASAVTRHLQLLEDRGLITRERVPGDQRNVAVSITQDGLGLIAGCSDKRELFLDTLFKGLEHDQIKTLLAAFSGIESQLDQATTLCEESDHAGADTHSTHSTHHKEI